MFTGIIETVGKLAALEDRGDLVSLSIDAPGIVSGVRIGNSVSVNGVCLTVVAGEGSTLVFEAVRETLERTSLGDLSVGAALNLERALRAGGRLDGHLVQGHVDGVGVVRELRREGRDVRLFVDCEPELAGQLVEKGSVAIDGVSLTVVGAASDAFDVALIPHTLEETTLGERRPGDRVNVEADVLGKYVKAYLARMLPRT